MKYKAKVSIIILNWNGKNNTLECLESVKEIDYSNFEVIVVDNGSTDGSPTEIRRQYPEITVLETGKNLGYAEGNNVGIRYAIAQRADFVFLLNNDAIVDSQILNSFLEATQLYPDAGIFGGKVYDYGEPNKIQFAGAIWDEKTCYFLHMGEGEIDDGKTFESYREVDFAIGCVLFFRKELIEKVGYLEPKFFLNYEETDWCFRSRRSGYKCIFVPKAKVWHKGAASFAGQLSPLYVYFMTRNELLWAERNLKFKHRVRLYKRLFSELMPRFHTGNNSNHRFIKRLYWASVKYFEDFRRRARDTVYIARICGIRDYMFRRFGDCPVDVRDLKKGNTRLDAM